LGGGKKKNAARKSDRQKMSDTEKKPRKKMGGQPTKLKLRPLIGGGKKKNLMGEKEKWRVRILPIPYGGLCQWKKVGKKRKTFSHREKLSMGGKKAMQKRREVSGGMPKEPAKVRKKEGREKLIGRQIGGRDQKTIRAGGREGNTGKGHGEKAPVTNYRANPMAEDKMEKGSRKMGREGDKPDRKERLYTWKGRKLQGWEPGPRSKGPRAAKRFSPGKEG